MRPLAPALSAGLEVMGLSLPPLAQARLLEYVALLQKWNRVYNLTAVREPELVLTHHLLDSLTILSHITGRRIVDVGCGAGLPGIPLALADPNLEVTLLDSNQKKAAFLRQAALELGLKNVQVVCNRAEAWVPEAPFDAVVSRAFSSLAEFVRLARHLCAADGKLLAMKGACPEAEILMLPPGAVVARVVPLKVPGLDAERHLVVLDRAG